MSFGLLRQEDKPSHVEISGKKDSWSDISKLYFPVWSPMWAQFSHPSVFWCRVIFNYIMLIFVHCFLLEPVFISVSLIVLSLFLSFFFSLTFLISSHIWICSIPTFANLYCLNNIEYLFFPDPHHMSLLHHITIIWSISFVLLCHSVVVMTLCNLVLCLIC